MPRHLVADDPISLLQGYIPMQETPPDPLVSTFWVNTLMTPPNLMGWDPVDEVWVEVGGGGAVGGAYGVTVGDGVATTFDVQHDLGTTDVLVAVYDLSVTPAEQVSTGVLLLDDATVRVVFSVAPATDMARVVVSVGGGGGTALALPPLLTRNSQPSSGSGTAFAAKGVLLRALVDFSIQDIFAELNQTTGREWRGFAALTTSAGVLAADAKTTPTGVAAPANGVSWVHLGALSEPLVVLAGEWFVIGSVVADGAATTTTANAIVVADTLAGPPVTREASASWQAAALAGGLVNTLAPGSLGTGTYAVACSYQAG